VSDAGGVAERLNAPALKAGRGRQAPRGFESHPLRWSRCVIAPTHTRVPVGPRGGTEASLRQVGQLDVKVRVKFIPVFGNPKPKSKTISLKQG
jgi:hypothetical protein